MLDPRRLSEEMKMIPFEGQKLRLLRQVKGRTWRYLDTDNDFVIWNGEDFPNFPKLQRVKAVFLKCELQDLWESKFQHDGCDNIAADITPLLQTDPNRRFAWSRRGGLGELCNFSDDEDPWSQLADD